MYVDCLLASFRPPFKEFIFNLAASGGMIVTRDARRHEHRLAWLACYGINQAIFIVRVANSDQSSDTKSEKTTPRYVVSVDLDCI